MVKKEELFDFKRSDNFLIDLVSSFEEYILGDEYGNNNHFEDCLTVEDKVQKLFENADIPEYMSIQYYFNGIPTGIHP